MRTHLRRGNTKPRLYKAASAQLVRTAYIYHTPSTNRNKPHLLPRSDVLTAKGTVHTTHKATASDWCMVHGVFKLQMFIGTSF